MVYAARQGWYKETTDQNILLPHDVLRILIQLLAWGDAKKAKRILPEHKKRLYSNIQDRLDYEKSEIQILHRDEVVERGAVLEKLRDKAIKNSERDKLEKRLVRLDEDMEKMGQELADAEKRAEQEREAVDRVEAELLEMFANPELSKRYFAIIDMTDIEENDFNLNTPRYVDTFEPTPVLDLKETVRELQIALRAEKDIDAELAERCGS